MMKKDKGAGNDLPVFSPLEGTAVPLGEVPNAVLASSILGRGLAVRPRSAAVFAPFDATVIATRPTGHAITLRHAGGVEVLIHIGVGTAKPNGEYFDLKVGKGHQVRAGDLLIKLNYAAIEAAGHDAIASVIVVNGNRYPRVVPLASGLVARGEVLFMAIAAENCADA